jgi:hypothetical protein
MVLPSRVGLWGAAGQKSIQNVRLKHGAEPATGYSEAEGVRRSCADREGRDALFRGAPLLPLIAVAITSFRPKLH